MFTHPGDRRLAGDLPLYNFIGVGCNFFRSPIGQFDFDLKNIESTSEVKMIYYEVKKKDKK